jgi:putative membrane protein
MKENYFLTFLKGILMGMADVIPGVSGGTIAFITGIYDRLIFGIKDVGNFIAQIPNSLKKRKLFSNLFKLDFSLFIPLVLGIGLSFIVGSQIMSGLMDKYPARIYSFFIGMIIASAIIIFRKIKTHRFLEIVAGILGFGLGLFISLMPVSTGTQTPSMIFLFFLGMLAICAMILPGISGAYIVLMFGQLKFMYDAIGNIFVMWPYLLVFVVGAVIGILLFSRVLSFLLKHHHSGTLYALTGIMVGALTGPVKLVTGSINKSSIVFSLLLFVAGIVIVLLIEKYAKN